MFANHSAAPDSSRLLGIDGVFQQRLDHQRKRPNQGERDYAIQDVPQHLIEKMISSTVRNNGGQEQNQKDYRQQPAATGNQKRSRQGRIDPGERK